MEVMSVYRLQVPPAGAECELALEQRDALEVQVKKLQEELERLHSGPDPQALPTFPSLEALSLSTLHSLQKQLRALLEQVDKAVFHMQLVKCLKCHEQNPAVLLCQQAVLCKLCAEGSECPICQPGQAHFLQSRRSGRAAVRRYPSSKQRSSGYALLEQP
ncbi:RING finger protein unkempt homolog [Bubalus kerabau]|uniref:RING finger protein unkempt homolog n=1 Tax=Bubalus carabanensis TaxID=3119969 RepID=UPI00244E765E|nr:RING finger protein unkempt homolog [Bubalus carabanensis]